LRKLRVCCVTLVSIKAVKIKQALPPLTLCCGNRDGLQATIGGQGK